MLNKKPSKTSPSKTKELTQQVGALQNMCNVLLYCAVTHVYKGVLAYVFYLEVKFISEK